jgi:TonB family protein
MPMSTTFRPDAPTASPSIAAALRGGAPSALSAVSVLLLSLALAACQTPAPAPAPPEPVVTAPPPPPPPPEEKKPEPEKPKPEQQKPTEKPKPNVRNQGMLALADELAELRDQNLDLKDPQMKTPVEDARSERNLITSNVGRTSGGINTSNMSRGFGGGAGEIGTHTTTAVQHGAGLDPNAGGHVQRTGTSGKASRAREEVEIVFDRNKGALYALYGRALRDSPELQGKLVLEFTIAPSGEITMCRVVSSELKDPELEKKIVARVRLIRFKPADVEPLTVSKPIDFFPAA